MTDKHLRANNYTVSLNSKSTFAVMDDAYLSFQWYSTISDSTATVAVKTDTHMLCQWCCACYLSSSHLLGQVLNSVFEFQIKSAIRLITLTILKC